eukprot:scaffold48_cov311-Pinguiococcus_pyrenoidosus.AAC.266
MAGPRCARPVRRIPWLREMLLRRELRSDPVSGCAWLHNPKGPSRKAAKKCPGRREDARLSCRFAPRERAKARPAWRGARRCDDAWGRRGGHGGRKSLRPYARANFVADSAPQTLSCGQNAPLTPVAWLLRRRRRTQASATCVNRCSTKKASFCAMAGSAQGSATFTALGSAGFPMAGWIPMLRARRSLTTTDSQVSAAGIATRARRRTTS